LQQKRGCHVRKKGQTIEEEDVEDRDPDLDSHVHLVERKPKKMPIESVYLEWAPLLKTCSFFGGIYVIINMLSGLGVDVSEGIHQFIKDSYQSWYPGMDT